MPRKPTQKRVKTIEEAQFPEPETRALTTPVDATLDEEVLQQLLDVVPQTNEDRERLSVAFGQFAEQCGSATRAIDRMMARVVLAVRNYQLWDFHPERPGSEAQYWALRQWEMKDINRLYMIESDIVPALELLGKNPDQELVEMSPARLQALRNATKSAMRQLDKETKADPEKAKQALQPLAEQIEIIKSAPLEEIKNMEREQQGLRTREPFYIELIQRITPRGIVLEPAPRQSWVINTETAERLDDHILYFGGFSFNGQVLSALGATLRYLNGQDDLPANVTSFPVVESTPDEPDIDFEDEEFDFSAPAA